MLSHFVLNPDAISWNSFFVPKLTKELDETAYTRFSKSIFGKKFHVLLLYNDYYNCKLLLLLNKAFHYTKTAIKGN